MNDSIKLAKAMGGMSTTIENGSWAYCNWPNGVPENFDPFTDANDDYAVLEWMRETWKPLQNGWPSANDTDDQLRWFWFKSVLCGLDGESKYNGMTDYQIGDYARAALKVLE